jgi:hypothetical protein
MHRFLRVKKRQHSKSGANTDYYYSHAGTTTRTQATDHVHHAHALQTRRIPLSTTPQPPGSLRRLPLRLELPRPTQDLLDHLIAQLDGLRESRRKIRLRLLEAQTVAVEVLERDCIAPAAGSKREFEVVAAETIVIQREANAIVQQFWLPEKVLDCSEPETEQLHTGLSVWAEEKKKEKKTKKGERGRVIRE